MRKAIILFALFITISQTTNAQHIELDVSPYLSGFSNPVDIANAGDGSNRLFVVERSGVVKVVEADTIREVDFMDISGRVSSGGERGLLGLAFHPNYEENGFFYVNYTRSEGSLATRVSRFSVSSSDPNQADPESELILMEFAQPFGNHNGGDLNFGPNDGYLYIATGDGGSAGDPGDRSQNDLEYLGKILRIDVNNGEPYAIPVSNPFATATDTLKEIWSTGLRNPWRFSFDRLNGNMWIADVGQGQREELNFEPANSSGGYNWGWRCYEGNIAYNLTDCESFENYQAPIFDYTHSNNGTDAYGFSVTGGYVYRGTEYPDMYGWYFMADYVTNHIWAVNYDGVDTSVLEFINLPTNFAGVSTFGEAENGDLFIATLNDGRILKLIDQVVVYNTELEPVVESDMIIFPNPTDGILNVQYQQAEARDLQVVLYNSLGLRVMQEELIGLQNVKLQYNLGTYPKGVYIIELKDGEGRLASKKFILE